MKPSETVQLMQPVLFPLSHYSLDALTLSPHVAEQIDFTPNPPVH